MPFRPSRKAPQFADLKTTLAQAKDTDNALYQVVQEIIDRLSTFQFNVAPEIAASSGGGGGGTGPQGPIGPPGPAGPAGPEGPMPALLETFATVNAEAGLANSRRIVAGTNVTLDVATAGQLKINAAGGGSGGGMNLDYLGNYAPGPTYNDGDIVIGPDGIAYMCVVDGTTTPPEPWPGTGMGAQGPGMPIGSVVMWPAAAAPTDWLLCQGQAISRTTFANLFAVLGVTYGAGDGSTTFNLPNMQQRFPLGKAASGTGSTLGSSGGVIDHTHNIPAHSHGVGTLAGASHSHDQGTLSIASHTHDQGSLTVASHTHGPGNLRTEAHSHGFSASVSGTTGSAGAHTHGVNITTSGPTTQITVQNGTGGNLVCSRTDHTHGVTGNTDSNGNHNHGFSGSASGTTDGDGGLFITSGATAAASPGLTGTTGAAAPGASGSTGAATVPITGVTASNAAAPTDANNPPFIVVNFIIRAA
jgi:microcystin-dependent protein